MESTEFLFIFIGAVDLVLAIGFIYYAFKNAFRLKGAVTQYLMATGAFFFVITGVISAIGILIFDTIFIVRYIVFIVGFILISIGEIYSGMIIRKIVGKKPWLTMARTFSHSIYRTSGILVILLSAIPLWTLGIIIRPASIYGMSAMLFTVLGFVLLVIGERKLYVATNVFSDETTIWDGKEVSLLRDDIAAVRVYADMINAFLSFGKYAMGAMIVDDILNKWSEEHPVLFENSVVGNGEIDPGVVTRNLDRLYEKGRFSTVLNEFSLLVTRLVDFYGVFTSSEYAKERLAESYKAIRKKYEDIPIVFDILRTMPESILEEEKLAVLNRDELEEKVKERTAELVNANKELQIEIKERRKAEKQTKKSLKEKEVLLKEIHHRVKNNLQIISSLLNLQAEHLKDKKIIPELLKESQNRIKSMSLIHEQLYQSQNLAKINFYEYIHNLTFNLSQSYGVNSDGISFKINAKNVFLGIDKAIPCGLIINELISNSLKHGLPQGKKGEIIIGFHLDNDNKFTLVVSDNGVGFPEYLDFRSAESLGLKLVNMLTQQIRGDIKLDRRQGTKFKITFPGLKNKGGG